MYVLTKQKIDTQYETLFYIVRSVEENSNGDEKDYKVQDSSQGQNLSKMFSLIENNKESLNIESYYISQTTLEQLFMSFANKSIQLDENQFNNNGNNKILNFFSGKIKNKFSPNSKPINGNASNGTANNEVKNPNKIVLLSFKQFEQPIFGGRKKSDQFYF